MSRKAMPLLSPGPFRPVKAHPPPAPAHGAWAVLDRLVQELDECEQSDAAVRYMLEAIRAGIGADAVFADSGVPGSPVELVSDRPLPAAWCRDFLRERLKESMADRAGQPRTSGTARWPGDPLPRSVIVVRGSRSQPLWLVALRFDGRRPFQQDDLNVVRLVRRVFCDHRRQVGARQQLIDAVLGVVHGLNAAIAAKCPFTSGHSERVGRMAVRLGRQMGLSAGFLSDLYLAGLLHDVGKIGVRDSVLQKPSRLSDDEVAHVREHPVIGDTIVARMKELAHLRPAVRNHHEHFDGSGYPDGLADDAIPLVARVLSIVDACDAMLSARPYRPGLPAEQVDAAIRAGSGTQWDPAIVACFLACRQELYGIHERGVGDSMLRAVEQIIVTRQAD
jgi:HD-GYP domain-containing protein (c-di-GMP phosphodiesterase class II)